MPYAIATRRDRFHRLALVSILSLAASVSWTIASGQDLNFDLITYHYYLGYSAFVPRLHLDFLPASVYGYQPPLPFMLLYWFDHIGTPPLVNAMLHASFHALNLVFLYLLAEFLVGRAEVSSARAKVIAFWLLGAMAPVYWTLVGTSFADVLTSVPVLAGLWLVARAVPESESRLASSIAWYAIAGALLGAAAGARIHNSIFVAALFCALLFTRFADRNARLRAIAAFSLAAFVAWLACFAPWGYRLYREFGSPLFPLFNGVFQSPDFPAANVPLISFSPESIWDLITLPFRMGTDTPWVYVELPLPDIRAAVLVLALAASVLLWALRRRGSWSIAIAAEAHSACVDYGTVQRQRVILVFFAVSTLLWLATSGNGRFGVALFLLGGPICGLVLSHVFPKRYVLLIISAVVLWQAVLQQVFFLQYRFDSMPWTTRYFDWKLPEHLSSVPATFISLGFQPASTLAPRLHPQSSHINLAGYPAIDAPGSERVRRGIDVPNRPVYGVFDVSRLDARTIKTYYRSQLALWELTFTGETCELIALRPAPEQWAMLNAFAPRSRYGPPKFMICKLQASEPADSERARSEYAAFMRKLAPLRESCPQFFGKPLGYVYTDEAWIVSSFASAETKFVFRSDGRFYVQKVTPPHVTLEIGRFGNEGVISNEPDCQKWFSQIRQLAKRAARNNGDTAIER